VNWGLPKKVNRNSRSKMSLVVDVYFECASESVKTEKEFLQGGQRDLKK